MIWNMPPIHAGVGAYAATYPVRGNSRLTLYVDEELRRVSGRDAVGTQIDVSADVSAVHGALAK